MVQMIFALETLICSKSHKNYGFIARMKTLSVPLPHRNRHYGNEHYDKTCRYEKAEKYLLLCPFVFIVDWLGNLSL
jgi:hypothetical protein